MTGWIPFSVRRFHSDATDPDFARFMEGADWQRDRWESHLREAQSQLAAIQALAEAAPKYTRGKPKTPESALLAAILATFKEAE